MSSGAMSSDAVSRSGKTYFITGGASGLGLATVEMLHSQGANVAIVDRDDKGAEIAAQMGSRAFFVKTDIMDETSVGAAVEKTVSMFGGLHGAVNCAGIGMAMTLGKDGNQHFKEVFDMIMDLHEKNMEMPLEVRGMTKSADGTTLSVGVELSSKIHKLSGKIQCPDCTQRFDTEKALRLHAKYLHAGVAGSMKDNGYELRYEFGGSHLIEGSGDSSGTEVQPLSKL